MSIVLGQADNSRSSSILGDVSSTAVAGLTFDNDGYLEQCVALLSADDDLKVLELGAFSVAFGPY
jgi:hypothetical protein